MLKARMLASTELGNTNETYRQIVQELAGAYFATGDFSNAAVNYLELERALRESNNDKTEGYALNLLKLAETYEAAKKYGQAARYYQSGLDLTGQLKGQATETYLKPLQQFARHFTSGKRYQLAEPLYATLLQHAEAVFGAKSETALAAWFEAAEVAHHLDQHEKALALLATHLQKASRAGKKEGFLNQNFLLAAQACQQLQQPDKAADYYLNYLKTLDTADKDGNLVEEHERVASLLAEMGQTTPAIQALKANLKMAENRGNTLEQATISGKIAELHQQGGNFAEAENILAAAVSMLQNSEHGKSAAHAGLVEQQAIIFAAAGKSQQAETTFLKAIELRHAHLGKQHQDYGTGLDHLAEFYLQQGQTEKAEKIAAEAISLKAETLGSRHHGYAESLGILASVQENRENFEAALKLRQEQVAIEANHFGRVSEQYAAGLLKLAALYQKQQKQDEAVKIMRQALTIYESLGQKGSEKYNQLQKHIREVAADRTTAGPGN